MRFFYVIYCHRKYLSILTSPLNSGLLSASSVFFCAGSWDSGMSSSSCVSIWDCCMSSIASTSSKISMVVVCFLLSGQHQNVLKSIPGTTSPPRWRPANAKCSGHLYVPLFWVNMPCCSTIATGVHLFNWLMIWLAADSFINVFHLISITSVDGL